MCLPLGGAGPVGLTSVLISARSGKAAKIILFEEKFRNDLINRPQQIALQEKNVTFLKTLGVDFDNIEGCWQNNCFFTRMGVFQEYMLGMIYRLHSHVDVDIRLNKKVTLYRTLNSLQEVILIVACRETGNECLKVQFYE